MFEVDSSTDEQHEDLEENMSFVDFVTCLSYLMEAHLVITFLEGIHEDPFQKTQGWSESTQ